MKKTLLAILGTVILLGGGCFGGDSDPAVDAVVEIDREAILFEAKEQGLIMNDDEIDTMEQMLSDDGGVSPDDLEAYLAQDFTDWSGAALADVTGGGSFGIAHAAYINGSFMIVADMGNVPSPSNGYFYEGWIVRRGSDMSVISTGRAQVVGEKLVNVYASSTNLADHDFYVLTLEPDDGDPAPAEHILEGTLR
jgi:hypothetical protein